ncbi:hypothetical protein EVAR_40406_1 [Eumeta japonica]|uniref:Uncharacterized protein n=1 Tax=Eumeta variegata TaxID=151549 RepID=A0A4C1WBX5_EUMVA|nr:hypothetical protein EVAR_40406_1 [Eumeta japonica]
MLAERSQIKGIIYSSSTSHSRQKLIKFSSHFAQQIKFGSSVVARVARLRRDTSRLGRPRHLLAGRTCPSFDYVLCVLYVLKEASKYDKLHRHLVYDDTIHRLNGPCTKFEVYDVHCRRVSFLEKTIMAESSSGVRRYDSSSEQPVYKV